MAVNESFWNRKSKEQVETGSTRNPDGTLKFIPNKQLIAYIRADNEDHGEKGKSKPRGRPFVKGENPRNKRKSNTTLS